MQQKIAGLPPTSTLVAITMRRGKDTITQLLAPTLEVVREPGKPARVEFLSTAETVSCRT